jgi:hypothetical protein
MDGGSFSSPLARGHFGVGTDREAMDLLPDAVDPDHLPLIPIE